MGHLGEAFTQVATRSLCGRVGVEEFRMSGFELLELVHEAVELFVSHVRPVQYIIPIVVVVELRSQFSDLLFFFHIV